MMMAIVIAVGLVQYAPIALKGPPTKVLAVAAIGRVVYCWWWRRFFAIFTLSGITLGNFIERQRMPLCFLLHFLHHRSQLSILTDQTRAKERKEKALLHDCSNNRNGAAIIFTCIYVAIIR